MSVRHWAVVGVFGVFGVLAIGCASAPPGEEDEASPDKESVGEAGEAITVSGMSNYCSKTYPTHGWTFNFGVADPCSESSGGTVRRAGMYSTSGLNHVIVRCEPNYIWAEDGYGSAPLEKAYAEVAATPTNGDCVFTVAPADMPIFGLPFHSNDLLANSHGSGFDFSRIPYDTNPTKVIDHRNHNVTGSGFINDHDAHDFGMHPGKELLAVADGTVIVAGFFNGSAGVYAPTPCNNPTGVAGQDTKPDCGDQAIIIVKHTVKANLSMYDEYFATGYFHAQGITQSILSQCTAVDTTGPIGTGGICSVGVKKGDVLGYSGRRGTNAAHLHFATWRLTNNARSDSNGFVVPNAALHAPGFANQGLPYAVGPSVVMDPYGWRASPTTDPWGYQAYFPSSTYANGAGALSIHLWIADPPYNWVSF